MKRIILGTSVLLMLVQNGFAKTNAEYDNQIKNETDPTWKQVYRCNKAQNHPKTSDVNKCLKAIELIKKNPNSGADLAIAYVNAGLIYDESGDDLNGYKYYMKSAKLGGKGGLQAQKNLSIMCKESPWACK